MYAQGKARKPHESKAADICECVLQVDARKHAEAKARELDEALKAAQAKFTEANRQYEQFRQVAEARAAEHTKAAGSLRCVCSLMCSWMLPRSLCVCV